METLLTPSDPATPININKTKIEILSFNILRRANSW